MAAVYVPDDSAFESKTKLEKYGNFASLKGGKKYLVTACESKTTGYGKKLLLELTEPIANEKLTLWAPADFPTELRKAGIKWKLDFWLLYKGREERALKETEGTYQAHVYLLAQPEEKDKSKTKSKSKRKAREHKKADDDESSA